MTGTLEPSADNVINALEPVGDLDLGQSANPGPSLTIDLDVSDPPEIEPEPPPHVVLLPTSDELIQGWRMFRGGYSNEGPLSGARGVAWEGRELAAVCHPSEYEMKKDATIEAHHLLNPDECATGNPCGIYLVAWPTKVIGTPELDGRHYLAKATAWGIVVPGETGWRAEHVRIEALWRIPALVEILAGDDFPPAASAIDRGRELHARYGVPVAIYSLAKLRGEVLNVGVLT